MKPMLCAFVFLLSSLALAQQPSQPRSGTPPQTTPPTFPEDRVPRSQMPPDQGAPPPEQMSTMQVQRQIEQHLADEPVLAGSAINVMADDQSVVLTGMVDTQEKHDLALQIAQSYAGQRRIIDRIRVTQRT